MRTIKTAVIGVGYLGQHHAEKYSKNPNSELVAVCDINVALLSEIAQKLKTSGFTDYQKLRGKVDAVSIAVPTPQHYEVARFFLGLGIHVLIEKPITTTIKQAEHLIEIAKKNESIIQVGHLERFNNVIKALWYHLSEPRFIESVRLAPFKLRGSDVNVILDVMIHDIDIIRALVRSKIQKISASGASVLSPFIDLANARIEFENGSIANVTASRVSLTKERSLRIFQHDRYFGLDLNRKRLKIYRRGTHEIFPGIPEITRDKYQFEKGDALKDQIYSFIESIINETRPVVTGEDGKKALEIAIQITNIIHEHNKRHPMGRNA